MGRRALGFALLALLLAPLGFFAAEPYLHPAPVVLLFHKTPEFEPVAAFLEHRGYHTLRLQELREYLRGTRHLPRRSVLLTFDDGDATNYLVAAEALQRHHQSGVFFLVTDRLGGGPPRPLSADSAGEADTWDTPRGDADMYAARHPGRPVPYSMRWSEARRMGLLGVAEMASHGTGHHYQFRSDALRGFVMWPDWKTVDALHGEERRGAPIFAGQSALLGPGFLADTALVGLLVRAARRTGGRNRALPVDSLQDIVRTFRQARGALGRRESRASYEARLSRELPGSRRRLEDSLHVPVTALAWPWGQYNAALRQRARAAGYDLVFTVEPRACTAGDDSLAVPRVSARPDQAWLRGMLWIYDHPSLARLYARMHPAEYPR